MVSRCLLRRSGILRGLALGAVVGALCCSTVTSGSAFAQEGLLKDTLGLKSQATAAKKTPVTWTVRLLQSRPDAREATLEVTALLPEEHYIYSTEQTNGAETKIVVTEAAGLTPLDKKFTADHPPKKDTDVDLFDKPVTLEKYYDKVIWRKKFSLSEGAKPESVLVKGDIKYQVCTKSACRILAHAFQAKLEVASPAAAESTGGTASGPALVAGPAATPSATDTATAVTTSATEVTSFDHVIPIKGMKQRVARWLVSAHPRQAKPGDEVTLTVAAKLEPGWHVYAVDQATTPDGSGPQPTVIQIEHGTTLQAVAPAWTATPAPQQKASKGFDGLTERYHEDQVQWTRTFRVADNSSAAAELPLELSITYGICDAHRCLPPKQFQVQGFITMAPTTVAETVVFMAAGFKPPTTDTPAVETTRQTPGSNDGGTNSLTAAPPPASPSGSRSLSSDTARFSSLFAFLVSAAIAGFAALLTPCVFPMIPITVNLFLKQSEQEHHKPFTMATVYCGGIIGTFTLLGIVMSVLFGAASINQLANNGWLNIVLAVVLIFFAMNLLGLFDIHMPGWLLTMTSGQEMRGGYLGVIFMSLTFTLTSFTCTFAFLGLLLAAAANGDWLWPILGLLVFSTAFALPFFFLALFPSMLKKLPRSGGWMNTVKVVMGLLEVGAAFKFLSVADLYFNPTPAIFDQELLISAWAVIAVTTGIYLLGMFRLPHDTPTEHIGALRLVFAMSSLGFAGYLGVGLTATEKPQGKVWEYVVVFASPRFDGGTSEDLGPVLKHGSLEYALDFDKARAVAAKTNRPLFIDITGVNCQNCRLMEKGPMAEPATEAKLKECVRVQMFVDKLPFIKDQVEGQRILKRNLELQEQFGDFTMPSYVILSPQAQGLAESKLIFSRYEGAEKRSGDFSRFLDEGLQHWQATKAKLTEKQLVDRH